MTSHPSYPPVSALRERMIEDMTVRGIGAKTRHDYVRHVRTFAAFIGRSPDTTTPEEVRRFQLHQTETGVGAPSINSAVSALRFLFSVTLDRPDRARRLTVVREARKLPLVLSAQEVALLLEAAPGPKYKAALATAYGAGLRGAEVVALKIGDVDSTRMMLRVEQGKGRRDRYAMLSPQLLALLRAWWREGRRGPCGRQAAVLRPARSSRRRRCLRRLPRPAPDDAVVRLLQETLRRAAGGAGLSVALHPPRRHLEPPAGRPRRGRRHVPLQGLPSQRPGAIPDHDPRTRRVHPALPAPRPAQGFPSHPPLRAPRERHPQGEPRPRQGAARRARAANGARPDDQSRRRADRPSPTMPVLRRAHDRRRDLRALRRPARPAVRTRDQERGRMTSNNPASQRKPAAGPRRRRQVDHTLIRPILRPGPPIAPTSAEMGARDRTPRHARPDLSVDQPVEHLDQARPQRRPRRSANTKSP
jgi:integrase